MDELLQEQNNPFFDWVKAIKGHPYTQKSDEDPSQPWEALGLGNTPSERQTQPHRNKHLSRKINRLGV